MAKILIIDDERPILESLEMFLTEKDHDVSTALSAAQGLEACTTFSPDVVILDVHLPDHSGFEVLKTLNALPRAPKVIMITAHHDMETTITAMKYGAYDYIFKPLDADEIEAAVEKAFSVLVAERECTHAEPKPESTSGGAIIGKSEKMCEVFKTIGVLCQNRATALILGETGTGKELIARVIHHNSPTCNEPMITVDCSAVVETLLESELFGHERGAFTGAVQTKIGKLELAGNGTLFIDEIGELPLGLQGKFLGFLERREFMRVGGHKWHRSNGRIIAATNRNLADMVRDGLFRRDLFYRLKVVTINVPPLRERVEDIPELARHFLLKANREMKLEILKFQEGVIPRLMAHPWPGNVRELENLILSAAVQSRGNVILLEDIEKALVLNTGSSEPNQGQTALTQMERKHIQQVLIQAGWNRNQAASLLGISLPTLRSKIRKYDLASPCEKR
ncbi:sigma-54-dependent transcriptional regulator [Desulfococcus multivorans]|uniref:DNA-binding transcriptional regulator NtrC n=1 Tax=Desulfococcus multivorans DSM 2059 TaxID=1121405 RepID=S7U795_DESML|nr:sigma-54 dependent transcriptional regulator [Desulfococcus multivorans]AOY59272.1 two component system response regulator, sigma54-specific + DNA binding [Desulfococcus multivorans]AQV01494.1 sigma-54-dependent Fis family transcriptional regulator [Desulfococcus multivorans]EPR45020.1 two component, sigma54 specific, transcriptional regulator, Fis family [Desulfococcus multivorans DSM 2059]SKA26856.1 two-component system, NtrC family, response regulator AtoC [Desulfococcus multivorans DSM 2